jgi:hypothetical protein
MHAVIDAAAPTLLALRLPGTVGRHTLQHAARWLLPPKALVAAWAGAGAPRLTALRRLALTDDEEEDGDEEEEGEARDGEAGGLAHVALASVAVIDRGRPSPARGAEVNLLAWGGGAPLASLRVACPSLASFPAAARFERLARLDASGCPSLSDAALHAVSSGAPRLAVLRIAGCASVGDAGLEAVADGRAARGGTLHTLDATDCHRVGDGGLIPLLARMAAVAREVRVGGTAATDKAVEALVPAGGGGRGDRRPASIPLTLDVTGCAAVTPASLRALADGGVLGRIVDLRAGHSSLLTPPSPCPACASRCAGRCAGSPLQLLARRAGAGLTSLALDGAPAPTPALAAVGAHCAALAALSAIGCPLVSEAGLAAVAAGCPSLASLALGGGGPGAAWSEGGPGLAAIAPGLASLTLTRRPRLTDADVGRVLAAATGLTSLSLAAAPRVTDAGLAPALPRLRSLRLTCCDGVTGAGLASPSLEALRLAGCGGVRSAPLALAVASSPRLRRLELPAAVARAGVPAAAGGHLARLVVEGGR